MTVAVATAPTSLDRVLTVVSDRLSIDPDWITSPDHARRPQAAFARRMFCFAASYYARATHRQIAGFLDVDERTIRRLISGYRDSDGTWQPGAAVLVQSRVDWYLLALQIREDLHRP